MNEIPVYYATLCLLVQDSKLLLYLKMRKVGKGCRNALGGGIEPGENVLTAAIREAEEETRHNGVPGSGIICDPEHMEYMARLLFHNSGQAEFSTADTKGNPFDVCVHVYLVSKWQGEPGETPDEMTDPQWFPFNALPFGEMLQADVKWLPDVLSGKKIIGEFWYNNGISKEGPEQMILKVHRIRVMHELPNPNTA